MQAINHVATALILKRTVPKAPLLGLIIAVEAVEYLWVVLNLIGVERTVVDRDMASVADVHLIHMPFSHSIAAGVILAAVVGGVILALRGDRAVALAIMLGILSHVLLDLAVHAPDIALAPFSDSRKYGTGLYATLPLLALGVETLWGLFCWWIYRGSWKLLCLMVVFGLSSIPFYSATINTGEAALSGQSTDFVLVILAQMLVTSAMVWYFAREPREG